MPLYETTFIARQDLSNQDIEKLADSFGQVLAEKGGKIVKREYWGLRNLAYIVRKSRKGHYMFLGIDAPFDALKEMERRMRFNEDVLRKLTVRVDSLTNEPSPIMNSRSGSDEEASLTTEEIEA
jgi:small subunit ribosomal protein S6